MKVGVFIPIGNNGWLISANAPQYKPTQVFGRLPPLDFDEACRLE